MLETVCGFGQRRVVVSGYVTDGANGEALIGATLRIAGTSTGTTSNAYGFYTLTLPAGDYSIEVRFVGYSPLVEKLSLHDSRSMNFALAAEAQQLSEMVVVGEKYGMDLQRPEMGTKTLPMKTIRQIPAMMGEVDLIKAVQMLPGVQATSEGSSFFSVRGGAGDQNLISLDEATVYNGAHLMGFFSIFNNDAINAVKIYKGDLPASAGGRLASLLDVRMKDGNMKRFAGTGGIGILSSRLTLEGPIIQDKSSFIVSGRRSYFDLFLPLSGDEDVQNSTLYFYDLNGKINFKLGDADRIYFSGYMGRDKLGAEFADMAFGNKTLTARWNHLFSGKVFANLSVLHSKYDYALSFSSIENNEYKMAYDMSETGLKYDLGIVLSPQTELKAGLHWTFHNMNPGRMWATLSTMPPYSLPERKSAEGAAYVQAEQKIGERFTVRYGLRWSLFANRGIDTVYMYRNYEEYGTKIYSAGQWFNWQNRPEPRIGVSFLLNDVSSLKASYARAHQYYQMATNSTSGTPLDVWFSADPNVQPQSSDQWSVGYNRSLWNRRLDIEAEIYYKQMRHVIDFKDHPNIMFNRKMDGELRFGRGYAWGIELMTSLNFSRLTGWISYAFSQSERKIDGIANEQWFKSPFEKPHSVDVALNYMLSEKQSIGLNWVFLSGQPATFPVARMFNHNLVLPIYSDRNTERYPAYHRLDLAYTLRLRKWGKVEPELNFSVYNAYARHNTWSISFEADDEVPKKMNATNNYLFSLVPSATLNIKF
jgi:hypothetical protein